MFVFRKKQQAIPLEFRREESVWIFVQQNQIGPKKKLVQTLIVFTM
jgi:hypothetical protein